jgi:hypothetical protein
MVGSHRNGQDGVAPEFIGVALVRERVKAHPGVVAVGLEPLESPAMGNLTYINEWIV